MGKIKRDNHSVTRSYLANWITASADGSEGIYYLDLTNRDIKFSPSTNARFAVKKDLYSPRYIPSPTHETKKSSRDDRFENWLSDDESHMMQLINTLTNRNVNGRINVKNFPKALRAIVSLGSRSEVVIDQLEMALSGGGADEDVSRMKTLNNIYNDIINNSDFFLRGTILVLHDSLGRILTNERPFMNLSQYNQNIPFALFPISPFYTMVLLPAESAFFSEKILRREHLVSIIQRKLNTEYDVELINFTLLAAQRMARKWVVCPSLKAAESVRDYLTNEVIEECRLRDRVIKKEILGEFRKVFMV